MGNLFFLNSMVKHGAIIAGLIVIAIVAIGAWVTYQFALPGYVVIFFTVVALGLGYFVMVIVDLVKVIKDMLLPQ